MDTIEPMVVRSPLGWAPPEPPIRRPWLRPLVVAALVCSTVIGSFWVRLPYYAEAPGSARAVDNLIASDVARIYPSEGEVLLTTISLYPVSPIEALIGWLRSDVDVVPEDRVKPPAVSDRQYRQLNIDVMDESKQTAVVVALRRLGHTVTERGEGALVERVVPDFPAQGRVRQGEIIKAVDGQAVNLVHEATAAIGGHRPGETVTLDLAQPDGSGPRRVELALAADPDQNGRPVLGVVLRTFKRSFDTPFSVDIKSGNIGGPSAGLAFTLGVLDALTPGELTGGRRVAATGTIEMDGRVGDVGGVAQKTSAVRRAGADLFLVPAGEYETARRIAGKGLEVVKVTTLQDALDALGARGGDLDALRPVSAVPPG